MTTQLDELDPAKRSEVFDDLYPEYDEVRRKIRIKGKRKNRKAERALKEILAKGNQASEPDLRRSEADVSRALLLLAGGVGAFFAAREIIRRARSIDMRGKAVVITGGSRGLGLELARRLADEGARLAICSRTPHELDAAKRELEARGAEVLAMPCDITNRSQTDEFARVVQHRYGAIDVLINNAGVMQVAPLEDVTVDDFQKMMNGNFYGALNMTFAVLPGMKRRGGGSIVNISSIGGKISVPHLLPYSASKFALTGFSEGLRASVAKDGISVTTVFPGTMRTGSHTQAEFKGQEEKESAWFSTAATTPLLSMSMERAAAQIITAFKQRRAQLVMPLHSEIAVKAHHLTPALSQSALSLVDSLLPAADNHEARLTKKFKTGELDQNLIA